MALKFMGKNPKRKYIRQIPNRNVQMAADIARTEAAVVQEVEEVVQQVDEVVEEVVKPKKSPKKTKKEEAKTTNETENKELNEDTTMTNETLEKINDILGDNAKDVKVKIEKKEKGLFERTENSTIVLNEDNKMLLTD